MSARCSDARSLCIALFALAALADYRRTATKEAEVEARELLDDLMWMRLKGFKGAAWGYNFDWQSRSFFAPRGTPKDLATQLNTEINKILQQPDIKTRLENDGAEVRILSIDQFAGFIQTEIEKYQTVIKAADIKAD